MMNGKSTYHILYICQVFFPTMHVVIYFELWQMQKRLLHSIHLLGFSSVGSFMSAEVWVYHCLHFWHCCDFFYFSVGLCLKWKDLIFSVFLCFSFLLWICRVWLRLEHKFKHFTQSLNLKSSCLMFPHLWLFTFYIHWKHLCGFNLYWLQFSAVGLVL